MTKKDQLKIAAVGLLKDKIQTVQDAETVINSIVDLLEKATHWKIKNKPIRLEIEE